MRALAVTAFALLLSAVWGLAEIDSPASHYSEVKLANKSDSLERIKNVKLLSYKFKYDSVPDRNIMGILGSDAQRWFPDCIDVVPSYPIPNKNKTAKNIVLTNFPVVDKNVLYMHGVAALQELLEKYDNMLQTIDSMDRIDKELALKYQTIDSKLDSEISLQLQEKLNWIELENEIARKQIELEELRNAEDRVLIIKQLDEEKKLLEFQAELAKQRMKLEEELEKDNLKNLLQLEKDLAEKREVMRRETAQTLQVLKMEQNKELENKKLENEKEKIRAEIKAKGDQERLNEEITIRKIQLQSKQDTERMVEGIKAVSKQVTLLVKDIFSRPKQVLILSGIVVALFLFFYLTKEFIAMLRQFIQSQIGRPSLVRETSYHWSLVPQFLSDLLVAPEKISLTFKAIEERFRNVILSTEDKERVINLAVATRNTRRSGAPYRHILLHGPPGTGKTLIARKLAECSGMDYAIMSGGDVAPLGEDAVNQLHDLFRWAGRSRKGLLVFIDEAEAFLSTRRHIGGDGSGSGGGSSGNGSKEGQDAHMRNALNALLYQTGTPSRNFMLVLATNRPEDLDEAILDRMDITLQISLPGLQQRIDLISLYMQVYVLSVLAEETKKSRGILSWLWRRRGEGQSSVDSTCLEPETLQRIAVKTSGFSGREIAKLFIAVQYAMYLAENQVLTLALFESTVAVKINDHLVKSGGFSTSGSGGNDIHKHDNLLDKGPATPSDVKRVGVATNGRQGNRKQ